MNQSININEESANLMRNYFQFKEQHLALKKLYQQSSHENVILQAKIQILETEINTLKKNNEVSTIQEQQKQILQFLRKKDDYMLLKTKEEKLNQKVELLEKKLESEKMRYEKEIQDILVKNSIQMKKIQESENKVNQKLQKLQKEYDELSQKYKNLNTSLKTMEIETNEIINKFQTEKAEYMEQLSSIELEYRQLWEKVNKPEKLQILEGKKKKETKFVKKSNQDRTIFPGFQSLDEAFNSNQVEIVPKPQKKRLFNLEKSYSPCFTDINDMEKL